MLSLFLAVFFGTFQSSVFLLISMIASEKSHKNLSDYNQFFSEKDMKLIKIRFFLVKKRVIQAIAYMTNIAHWIKNPFRRTSEHNHKYNYLNFLFFHKKKSVFYQLQIFLFYNKNGCSLIDFDVVFSMQSLEFTKQLNFGSISK